MQKGYVFDLDGTIYLSEDLIDGAKEAIRSLRERGDKVVFLTNKSIARRTEYVEKLGRLGIGVTLDEVVSSNYITAHYLKSVLEDSQEVYVIGEEPLVEELRQEGIALTGDWASASYVVLGWDRSFTYEKINAAFQAWKNGAVLIATNPDRTCPVEGGELPDCAAMIGALEGVTGEQILVTGKPSGLMAKFVMESVLGMPADRCVMVGDRLETDVKMANEAGMTSVLVLSGITDAAMAEASPVQPDYVLESVAALPAHPGL
ncbi:HAD-IIA family hydrolase [Sporosarcina koreensis]|uniref:HAD-IIA family hydrolase n=1 Tax=Sporosarcina koreensis TaxID=334735 RepID=UPI00058AC653|nr:HAD-IIA family hydrolase [Sporosarcina koreensis]